VGMLGIITKEATGSPWSVKIDESK